jgi:hypothetical protein
MTKKKIEEEKEEVPVVLKVKGRVLTIPTTKEITRAGQRYDVIFKIDPTKEKSKAPNVIGNVVCGMLGIMDLGPAGNGNRFFLTDIRSGSGLGNAGHTQARDALLEAFRQGKIRILAIADVNGVLCSMPIEAGNYTEDELKDRINDLVGKSNSARRKSFIIEVPSIWAVLETIVASSVDPSGNSISVAEAKRRTSRVVPQPRTGIMRSTAQPKPSVKTIVDDFIRDATRIGTNNEAEIEQLVLSFVVEATRVPRIRAKTSVVWR